MSTKRKPSTYRLTLKPDAICAIETSKRKLFRCLPLRPRAEGGADVLVSMSIMDQLMTYAQKGENLSDAVKRLYAA